MLAERELTQCEASERLHALAKQLNLSVHLTGTASSHLVSTCDLIDPSGTIISSGAGKGQASALGALAESIEHYFTTSPRHNKTERCSGNVLISNPNIRADGLLQSLPAACSIPSYDLVAVDQTNRIKVPAVLLTPSEYLIAEADKHPEYSYLKKYSSNSGTAIGGTENEALLHAINESIERHVLSAYYLSACHLSPPLVLYTPSASFLSKTFGNCPELLKYSATLHIYMTDLYFDVPFCIAVPKDHQPCTLAPVGSGCSTDPAVALYRAVTEQLQCNTLNTPQDTEKDVAVVTMLSGSATLKKLLHPLPQQKAISFNPHSVKTTPRQQIKTTLENLRRAGRTVFQRELFNTPGLACALQVYIPGLDRFHLIRSGIPVAPQHAFSNNTECRNGRL